ncbi:hypothetical protein POM88_017018 [Heracleum sosnowskyi]|uniref:CCHC-type domain-containing protein n=1 Tax=Heracleum sosnowskyi TaxID=360622 RepID=A0AAD8IRT0_9APIA|nr:hypothetical protein POM88_017018 [Heracleum sosnowskyi]
MEEMVIMMVRGFKKMKFRKARRQGNFQKRTFNTNKGKYIKKDSKGSKFDKSKVRCYKCNGMGHFATECKKTKALITSSKDWMDSFSESDTEVTVISIDSKITRTQNVARHDSIFTLTTTLAEDYATSTLALDSKLGNLDSTLCGELILSPKEHSCDSKLCGKSNCLEKDPCSRYLLSQIP